MGYMSGLISLLGLGVILLSLMDNSFNAFILSNSGLVVGLILVIIGFIGFLSTFNKRIE